MRDRRRGDDARESHHASDGPGPRRRGDEPAQEQDLPRFKELDGFRGFTLFVDRSSGKVIGTSYWNSAEQMQASEEAVKDARRRAADTGGSSAEPQVERFEVALDSFVR